MYISKTGDVHSELASPSDGFRRKFAIAVLGYTSADVGSKHYNIHDFAEEKRDALNRWALTLDAIPTPRGLRQRKFIIEPEAVEHFLFAALRPDFSRHFTLDAPNVIEIIPALTISQSISWHRLIDCRKTVEAAPCRPKLRSASCPLSPSKRTSVGAVVMRSESQRASHWGPPVLLRPTGSILPSRRDRQRGHQTPLLPCRA